MRDDLVVPGEHEEKFVLARDTRVVTVPFTPLEERFAKEKPQLIPCLKKLYELIGDEKYRRYVRNIHNINVSGHAMLIVAESELHRTNIEREVIKEFAQAFDVDNIRVVTQG